MSWRPSDDGFARHILPDEQRVFDALDKKKNARSNPKAVKTKYAIDDGLTETKKDTSKRRKKDADANSNARSSVTGLVEQDLMHNIDEDETTDVRRTRGQRSGDSFQHFDNEHNRREMDTHLNTVVQKRIDNRDLQVVAQLSTEANKTQTVGVEVPPPSRRDVLEDNGTTMVHVAPAWRVHLSTDENYSMLEIRYLMPLMSGRVSPNAKPLMASIVNVPLTEVAHYIEGLGPDFANLSFWYEPNGDDPASPIAWARETFSNIEMDTPEALLPKATSRRGPSPPSFFASLDQKKRGLIVVGLNFSIDRHARFMLRLVYVAYEGSDAFCTPSDKITRALRRLDLSAYNPHADLAREAFFEQKFASNSASGSNKDTSATERCADTPDAINNIFFVFAGYYYHTHPQSFSDAQTQFTMAQDEFVIFDESKV